MSSTRKILTLHPPLGDETLDVILTSLEKALLAAGASRIWVESESYPDLTVVADMPDLHLEQGAGMLGGQRRDGTVAKMSAYG